MTATKKIGTAEDARKIIESYAEKGRTTCWGTSLDVCNCWRPLGILDEGLVTPEEQMALRTQGFSDEFIREFARDGGKYALRQRVKWLGEDIFGFYLYESDGKRFDKGEGMRELAKIGEEARTYIFKGLGWNVPRIRRAAVEGLGNLTSDPNKSIFWLRRMLKDDDYVVRTTAVVTLRKFGHRASPAFFDLVGMLKDKEETENVKLAVFKTLSEIEPDKAMLAEVVVPYLGTMFQDEEEELDILSVVVDCGISALPPLLKMLETPSDISKAWQRGYAAKALGTIAEKHFKGEEKGTFWERGFQILAKIAGDGEENTLVRTQAIEALGFFPKSIALLWTYLGNTNSAIREAAAKAISHFKIDDVKDELANRLTSPVRVEQHGALLAIQAFNPKDASILLPDVIRLVAEQDSGIAHLAGEVVKRLDQPNRANFPRLKNLLFHPDLEVRKVAARKLGEIFGEQVGLAVVPIPASAMNPAQVVAQSLRVLNGQ